VAEKEVIALVIVEAEVEAEIDIEIVVAVAVAINIMTVVEVMKIPKIKIIKLVMIIVVIRRNGIKRRLIPYLREGQAVKMKKAQILIMVAMMVLKNLWVSKKLIN